MVPCGCRLSGGLFHMHGAVCEQIGPEHGYPGGFPAAVMVDREGTVWVRTLGGSFLLYRSPGPAQVPTPGIRCRHHHSRFHFRYRRALHFSP